MTENIKKVTCFMIFSFARNFIFEVEEESDDEEELILLICTERAEEPHRITGYIEHVVPHYTTTEFQQHFRLPLDAFEYLLEIIGPVLLAGNDQSRRPPIEPRRQLLAVIWLLATPDSYRSVGEKFNMAKSSLSVCFFRVVNALCSIAPNIIKWPQRADCGKESNTFKKLSNISNVIGVIDGSYIPIKAPKKDAEVYINRKCFYAITLQGVCSSNLKFIDCFTGYPSSVSDVRIFRNSDIYRNVMCNTQRYFPHEEFLLGDKAYPLLTWLITPYIDRGNLSPVQRKFNETHSKTRQVIERTFALLKGRFRRLKYLDMNRTDLIPATILACCVLHNVCIDHKDTRITEYVNEGLETENYIDESNVELQNMSNVQNDAFQKRENMANQLYR